MAENTEYTPLPADLPEDWTPGQTVAPNGADVGLTEQHGYNYLNKQVNDAQKGVNQLQEGKQEKLTGAEGQVVGFNEQGEAEPMEPPSGLPPGGAAGQLLGKTGAEDYQAGWVDEPETGVTSFNGRKGTVTPQSGDYSVSQVTGAAPTASPVFTGTVSLGRKAGTTVGNRSVAIGDRVTASGYISFAAGEGTTASGGKSFAEGNLTIASGLNCHAEGASTTASGGNSHAGGAGSVASATNAFAYGQNVIAAADNQFVIGRSNVESTTEGNFFIIGKSFSSNERANCFRVTTTGVFASGNYNASGADYAELFEWLDGNPDKADRCGRFVTLDGEKIRIATPDDDYILGIVSGNPSVVGDVHDDQWQGMYLYDVFGRPLWEDVEVPDETVEEPDPENPGQTITRVIIPAHTEHRQKLNPAYDNAQPYLPRSQRPEWDAVGMLGKLVAVDDGTCQANGWCTVGEFGAATRSETRTRYRVMARLDETHVRVLIL